MHATDGEITYFWNYHKQLDTFLHKESIKLTTGKYALIVIELDEIREYIKYLEYIELINIEVTFKEFASFNVNKI